MIRALLLITRRELTLAFRRWSDVALPLMFFIIVCMLFPLALGQEPDWIQVPERDWERAQGLAWIADRLRGQA